MQKILARVVPQPKGTYDPKYNYNILDTVQDGAAIYQSRKADNQGHPVTDTDWWRCFYDLSEAIKAASSTESETVEDPKKILRLMAIGTDGKPYSIEPHILMRYIVDSLSDEYDLIAIAKNTDEE